jgi:hypothetical protein
VFRFESESEVFVMYICIINEQMQYSNTLLACSAATASFDLCTSFSDSFYMVMYVTIGTRSYCKK